MDLGKMKKGLFLLVLSLIAGSCSRHVAQVEEVSTSSNTYEEAFIYGFPSIVAYQVMYQFNVDRTSSQYKAPFNQIWSESFDFTLKDTTTTTPNLDAPYSSLQVDDGNALDGSKQRYTLSFAAGQVPPVSGF
jgi:hypothetical protein